MTAGVELFLWDKQANAARPYGRTNTFDEAQEALRRRWREEGPPVGRPAVRLAPEEVAEVRAAGPAPRAGEVPVRPDGGVPGEAVGIRDLADDPEAEETIRRLAAERVRRDRERQQA